MSTKIGIDAPSKVRLHLAFAGFSARIIWITLRPAFGPTCRQGSVAFPTFHEVAEREVWMVSGTWPDRLSAFDQKLDPIEYFLRHKRYVVSS